MADIDKLSLGLDEIIRLNRTSTRRNDNRKFRTRGGGRRSGQNNGFRARGGGGLVTICFALILCLYSLCTFSL